MIRPRKSVWVQRGFRAYNRRFLRRSFHRIHLDGDLTALHGDGRTPLLVCVNHSSWWDLLLGILLDELLPEWDSYAPMDERQLRRYRFFSQLGVIGVDRASLHGAREFVDYCRELLEGQPRALWITPQGEFTSSSVRPVRFLPGIGAVGQALSAFYAATVVFDYEFWAEKRPEAFLSIRPAERIVVGEDFDRRAFIQTMERNMEAHLNALTALRQQRDAEKFVTLLSGSSVVSPVYDTMRALAARLRGERFVRLHEGVTTPRWRELKRGESSSGAKRP